jgi:hypothetical protein
MFQLLKFLAAALGGFGVNGIEAQAVAELKKIAASTPEIQDQINTLEKWITDKLAPTHDVARMRSTILGIATDIVHGTAGKDPSAWMGSV